MCIFGANIIHFMQEHHLSVTRTARYFTLGSLDNNTQQVWFVLHGYGQLAQFFIRKFEILNDRHVLDLWYRKRLAIKLFLDKNIIN